MAIRTKTANTQDNQKVFGLLAGIAGVGKTTQLTTFPKHEIMSVSVENGFLSIAGSGYEYDEIDDENDLIQILEKAATNTRYKNKKYIFIDSLSELYDHIVKRNKDKFTAAQNFAKHDEITSTFLYLIRLAKNLPQSVYFTCHTKEDKTSIAGDEELRFMGQLPAMIKGQFDFIVHMKDVQFPGQPQKTKCFITSSQVSKVAKKRESPFLGIKVEDYEEPNLYKLSLKLTGKAQGA